MDKFDPDVNYVVETFILPMADLEGVTLAIGYSFGPITDEKPTFTLYVPIEGAEALLDVVQRGIENYNEYLNGNFK